MSLSTLLDNLVKKFHSRNNGLKFYVILDETIETYHFGKSPKLNIIRYQNLKSQAVLKILF